ncbi:MAG: hypothetical protein ACKVU2_03575 [Saprospiraceae bacterium]
MPTFAVLLGLLFATAGFGGRAQTINDRTEKPNQEKPEFIIADINIP